MACTSRYSNDVGVSLTVLPSSVLSGWNVHEMKARKPGTSSCSSRRRRMCSTRSASVSTWPYIIVADVVMPWRCAWRMTSSHSSLFVFFGARIVRTRSTRISPPPPGIESRPASRRREIVSAIDRPARREMYVTSGGESACMWNFG